MEANELMIGDWCRRRSIYQDTGREVVTDFQITQICKNGENLYVYGPKGNMGRVDQIEPIPLTHEILEKNGFEKEKLTNVTIWRNGNFSMEFNAMSNRFYYGEVVMDFVHQFQHLIRLCGIEKEIEL